ncbi:MAG: M1 family aminopeptidase [Phycisphaerae bacterium]
MRIAARFLPALALAYVFGISVVAHADDQRAVSGATGCVREFGESARRDGRPFDERTGRDTRNFPPDPQVDYQHLLLDVHMEHPESRSFRCDETLTFRTLAVPLARLELDAVELKIERVTDLNDKPLVFRHDDKRLTVSFDAPLAPETDGGVKIAYECHDPKEGMFFALPDAGYPNRALMVHTQGESEFNRYWFVCHDFPNERFTSEIIATVPAKLTVISNGRLVERTEGGIGVGPGLSRWHYRQEQPHASYLVSLIVGEFASGRDSWREKSVEYYVPPQDAEKIARTFGKTPKMIETFSKVTGFDYPYPKYSQASVHLFQWGGMENTSATTLLENMSLDERALLDQDEEGLISHELAHQWFGDLVTCRGWPHIWLNEGFATYMSAIWEENERGREAYETSIWNDMMGVADSDSVDLAGGVVFPYYNEADEVFTRGGSNPYSKGCSAIHMLRCAAGDEIFWRAIREYLHRYAWKTAETDDLRHIFEELTGQSYERFFHQWLIRPGVPQLRAEYAWSDADKQATVKLTQTQPISAKAPAFACDLEVWLVDAAGKIDRRVARIDERNDTFSAACDAEPAQVVINPRFSVLTRLDSTVPAPMLIRQLESGPTMFARLSATRVLSGQDRDDVRDALKKLLVDEAQNWGLRNEAAASLGRMQKDGARDILLDVLAEGRMIAHHRVRRAAVDALSGYKHERVAATMLRLAKGDAAYGVEAAATGALGRQEPSEEIIATLLANSQKPSQGDQIRQAAVRALADLDEKRGLEPAMRAGAYGQPYHSRPTGIDAVGRIGRKLDDKKAARDFLVALIDDPQDNAAETAIRALGTLDDEEAIGPLERLAAGSTRKARRDAARGAIDAIRGKHGEDTVVRELRERVKRLEDARTELERGLKQVRNGKEPRTGNREQE